VLEMVTVGQPTVTLLVVLVIKVRGDYIVTREGYIVSSERDIVTKPIYIESREQYIVTTLYQHNRTCLKW